MCKSENETAIKSRKKTAVCYHLCAECGMEWWTRTPASKCPGCGRIRGDYNEVRAEIPMKDIQPVVIKHHITDPQSIQVGVRGPGKGSGWCLVFKNTNDDMFEHDWDQIKGKSGVLTFVEDIKTK